MDALVYQGLFYLAAGSGLFVTLLLGLRLISERSSEVSHRQDGGWVGLEELEVVEVIAESRDVKSFRLRRANGQRFPKFLAGQFLTVQIGDDTQTLRSYSISSSPYNRVLVQISAKLLPSGVGSSWLHRLVVGDRLKAHAPAGRFTDSDCQTLERVYVAGGIGITPLLSMITANIDKSADCKISLFYGVRTEKDLAFHEILVALSSRHRRLSYFPVLSEQTSTWQGDRGFINLKFIKSKCKSLDPATEFYICGPEAMSEPLVDELLAEGIAEDSVHVERFVSPESFDRSRISQNRVEIEYQGRKLQYRGRQTVLEFLEEQKINHPSACRVGVCGTCKCRVEGKVFELQTNGLSRAEKKQGYILSCVAFPLSDLKIMN